MTNWFHIQSATMEPCALADDAYVEAQQTWLCQGCGAPKPDVRAVDVRLQDVPGTAEEMTFVGGVGVPIARKSFLLTLGSDVVLKNLFLGKVMDARGKPLPDWVTFRGRRRVIIRGSEKVSRRVCAVCGRHVYFAMGKRYLSPAPPPETVLESDLFGLVLPDDLRARLDVTDAEKSFLAVEELPVLSEPLDGENFESTTIASSVS